MSTCLSAPVVSLCRCASCGLLGCKNKAWSISWPEIVKRLSNWGVTCFVSCGSFFCLPFVFRVHVMFCVLVFGCQYEYNRLPGKCYLQNKLLCHEWDVKPYVLTHLCRSRNISLGESKLSAFPH